MSENHPQIEIRPGHVWQVFYEYEDGTKDVMIVSAVTIEEAIKEARYSLEPIHMGDDFTPYNIVGARR